MKSGRDINERADDPDLAKAPQSCELTKPCPPQGQTGGVRVFVCVCVRVCVCVCVCVCALAFMHVHRGCQVMKGALMNLNGLSAP